MKILDLQVMKGPNYWSRSHHRIVVLKVDLEELERAPTHQIDGFTGRLKTLLPSLWSHRCSHDHEGGFFEIVEQGTWMGHVAEHIALELQCLAGMEVGFGRTLSGKEQGIYHVLFEYQYEKAGRLAAQAAVDICEALVASRDYDVSEDVAALKRIARREKLGPSTNSIVEEAVSRGIPYKRLDGSSLLVLGYGDKQKKVRATVAGTTFGIGIEIARDKEETKTLLAAAHVPVPAGVLVHDEQELTSLLPSVQFPVVLKPLNGNHGRGITTNVRDGGEALEAFRIASTISKPVILEEFVEGDDYRLIVVNYKFVAAARRTPAQVIGDGRSTIAQLIAEVNRDPMRGEGHDNMMTKIELDAVSESILQKENLQPGDVLPRGKKLQLKHTANISTGGTAEDVTDVVHPYNVFLAERIARIIGLDICGIDILARDITRELTRDNGAVVEVNAGPGLRMHLEPFRGQPRNIARPIIDMLFPGQDRGRIPLVAITGTNGKTTTTRLTAHLAQHAGGRKVGFTTTDGIYIKGEQVHKGDCTGPRSTEVVLFDPTIDFAVLECARGGLLRSGLSFTECDVSIVTNVSADHLGLKDIHTLEELARVKAVVPRTTRRDGYAILNADDDLVYDMAEDLDCHIALFSMSADNERVARHCREGGLAAVVQDGHVVVIQGKWRSRVEKLTNIPLTFDGRAGNMIKNVLPAVLVAWIFRFEPEDIKKALRTFVPSPQMTPGRMNIFAFGEFQLMVDYAHNLDGMTELKKFLDETPSSRKVGIIGIAGDRRDEDIRAFGAMSASVFDEIIIRHDSDMRGREKEDMTELLIQGIESQGSGVPVKVISSELEALRYAIDHAGTGTFITICTEKVSDTLAFVEAQHTARRQRSFQG
jgi:cyanophycin synthetase